MLKGRKGALEMTTATTVMIIISIVVIVGGVLFIQSLEIELPQFEAGMPQFFSIDVSPEQAHQGTVFQVDVDFSDKSFDAVFSHNVLEHLPEPNKALQEMYRVLKPGGVIGIRNIDADGGIFVGDDKLRDKLFAFLVAGYDAEGGNPRIGRHLGRLLYEAGFIDIKMSASYDVDSDPEDRKIRAKAGISRLSDTNAMNQLIRKGITTVEELASLKEAWRDWAEVPAAMCAISHCEAIGRKA